jgi:hypothetical protein
MIVHEESFPHPVLAPFRDDVSPNDFRLKLDISSDTENWYLSVKFEYSNPTLEGLITSGKVTHSIHVECRRNFYRELFSFSEPAKQLVIKANELVGRVEVSGFICAHESMEEYTIEGAHPDYGNAKFQIRVGDILAVDRTQQFEAYVDYDPLKNIASILTIRRDQDREDGPMLVDTNGDIIIATLAQNDYDKYIDLKGDPLFVPLLVNQVVVPVLLEAVHEIKDVIDEEFEESMAARRWYRSVYKKLFDSEVDLRKQDKTALDALQTLLQLPLRRSLHSLMQIGSLEEAT